MISTDWPIAAFAAHDVVTVGTRLWRQRQQLFATVVVKSTFLLVPGGTMTPRAPLPIESAEHSMGSAGGIEPGDLAPYLMQPEIWVRGHAWYPPAQGATSVRARLLVARDNNPIVRKSVELPIESVVPPFLHALAPLSESWPIRTRLLGNGPPIFLDKSPLELPDAFDWNYFQVASADQRSSLLRGDEWIRLEGIHPTLQRFDTRLPSAWSAAALFGPIESLRSGAAVQVRLDTVQIDADHGWCALLFRGHVPVPAHVPLSELQFVAGLALPDQPMPKLEPHALAGSVLSTSHPTQQLPSFGDTMVLDVEQLPPLPHEVLRPTDHGLSRFPSSIPPSAPPSSIPPHATLPPDETNVRTAAPSSLPFRPSSSEPTISLPVVPQDEPAPTPANATPEHGSKTTTLQFDEIKQQDVVQQTVLPFHAPLPESTSQPAELASVHQSDVPSALPFSAPQTAVAEREAPTVAADAPQPQTLGEFFLAAMEESGSSPNTQSSR